MKPEPKHKPRKQLPLEWYDNYNFRTIEPEPKQKPRKQLPSEWLTDFRQEQQQKATAPSPAGTKPETEAAQQNRREEAERRRAAQEQVVVRRTMPRLMLKV